MSISKAFDVSSTALGAQSLRLNLVASNLANADTAASSSADAYKAQRAVFQPVRMSEEGAQGVEVSGIEQSQAPERLVYEPSHPMADATGYVHYSNVNLAEEMADMVSASRNYQANLEAMGVSKALISKTLSLGQ